MHIFLFNFLEQGFDDVILLGVFNWDSADETFQEVVGSFEGLSQSPVVMNVLLGFLLEIIQQLKYKVKANLNKYTVE